MSLDPHVDFNFHPSERWAHIRMLYAENTALRKAQDAGLTGHLLYLAKRAYVRFRR